jgi:hypothetical protein
MTPVLPRKIRVRHFDYKIILTDDWIQHPAIGKARGTCDPNRREIKIYRKQTPRMLLRTFWHEVKHAFEFEWRIKLDHQVIYDLEKPMADLFLKNPALRRHIRSWRQQRPKRRESPGTTPVPQAAARRRKARSARPRR